MYISYLQTGALEVSYAKPQFTAVAVVKFRRLGRGSR